MKKILTILLVLSVLAVVLLLGAKFYLESNFQDILNKSESRKYDIVYKDISIDLTLNGITLSDITITPVDTIAQSETGVYGTVTEATLEGIDAIPLIFSDKLAIDQLRFQNPSFIVYLKSDTTKRKNVRNSMGQLFGEIIKRASLKNFGILEGDIQIFSTKPDSVLFGSAKNITIDAYDIQTDKSRINFIIPFEVGGIHSHLENIQYVVDEQTDMVIRRFDFNSESKQLLLEDIAMKMDTSWLAISSEDRYHKDLIEFDLRSLLIDGIDMSSVYGDSFRIQAKSLTIDSLHLEDFRNKRRPEPPDQEKPMFKGMIDHINVPIDVDSILINNSFISYTEMPNKGEESGTIIFSDINGFIEDVSSDSVRQETLENFHAHLDAKVNHIAPLSFDLVVPYSNEHFYLDARIEPFNLDILNQTMEPLAGVRIDSGRMESFQLRMSANRLTSENEMSLSYVNLKLSVVGNDQGEDEKNGLLSVLANIFVKKNDDSAKGKESTFKYVTDRNIYRGPFNFMWQSVKEGIMQVAPSTVGSLIMPGNDQKEED